ncbi:cbb3-type cytochrome c oxidase N-terminal domain-containing protein [Engelhardtia mirabilis]|uniref:Cbb3-type cytochrome c oxidase subunit CcoP2 n=1 Tax=Engelhardtia mirabilis TaxID=2528011 RepID=A0A518BIJ3_9BACT|nr:Cbb3-type cytochrome c oxidase subunit CcoP2 [Planctomycetes bacterium Pla133]QDV01110.1 Cbb3-type cytochrome c oxidase subunit CcoP2 [Planctomycetes bacterium Pla86]
MSEPENELLLDHEYDGIREYDNPLPAWWVYTWLATVLICFPYVAWFHGAEGRTIQDQYEQELTDFAQAMIATYGDLDADQDTILRYMQDDVAMAGMASQFKGKCATCHRADGSGNVGPNLTDDSWINVTKVEDIVGVIRNGVPAKGMTAWGGTFSDTQLVLMAAYVASLRLHPVDGKAPQGNEIAPWPELAPTANASGAPAADAGTQ